MTCRTLIITGLRFLLLLVVFAHLGAPWAQAQCAGDCHGDGEVTVDELLILVNIALENSPIAECSSGDTNSDGLITVDEIVAAVNKALLGCAPSVSGVWQQDQVAIATSTCAAPISGIVVESITAGDFDCLYQLEQHGQQVTITATCADETFVVDGTVDSNGQLTATSSEQDTFDGCAVSLTQIASGNVTMSPAVGTHTLQFTFSPSCGFANCTVVMRARWTKVS